MLTDDAVAIVHSLGVVPDAGPPHVAGASGARVVPGHDERGVPVVVKIGWHDSVDAARAAARELALYSRRSGLWPVPTPRLLNAFEGERCTALVLSRHPPAPPARRWTTDLWHRLVDTLVLLHETGPPDDGLWSWSRAPGLGLDGPDRAVVDRLWSSPQDQRCLAEVVADLSALEEAAAGPDQVFSHGDCHTENVLVDGGVLLLADWQSAGFAPSCGDLAFALLRAVPDGAVSAVQPLVERYAAGRGLVADEVLRAVTASQLLVLTRQYPHFAAYLSPTGTARLRNALHQSASTWRELSAGSSGTAQG